LPDFLFFVKQRLLTHAQDYSQGGFDSQHIGGSQATGQQQQQQPEARKSNVRPVTIRQLLAAEPGPDDIVLLDHKPLRHVRFVGVVRGVTNTETGTRFRIEDGTGMVDARLYSSGAGTTATDLASQSDFDGGAADNHLQQHMKEEARRNDALVDHYVSVFARVSITNERHNIAINDIRAIEDFNEVAYHMLNAIHHHVASVGGFVGQHRAGASAGAGSNAGSLFVGGNGAAIAVSSGGAAGNLSERVLEYLRRYESVDCGMHIQSIVQGLGSDYSTTKEVLESLNEEGYIYNPDDDHYAITPQN
jgi:replication factor A2